jgi:UDP-N-acetylglucosamine acyltransferase
VSVTIHPTAVVDPAAQLADGVSVGPYCTIGPNVRLAEDVQLISHVVVSGRTSVGRECVAHPFCSLGGAPQHVAYKGEDTTLVVGERNVMREQVSMHTGTVMGGGVTEVGSDGLFMIGAHVAHDCKVGDHVTFANGSTLAGHTVIGDWVFMGGLCAVHQFTRIGRHAFIGGGGIVTKDVIPYGLVWGNHAHLEGLNLVGLKRRGFGRETINHLRSAYRLMFADEGTFQERLDDALEAYGACAEVAEIIGFIRADAGRPLCLPAREV